jgi:O-antigen/teichoic acid export membrane protein
MSAKQDTVRLVLRAEFWIRIALTTETAIPPITGAEARRAARNAGAIAAASILSRGLQFGWQLILVPGLGPAAYGIYGAVAAFIMVGSSIPNFGMGPIFIRDLARHPERTGKYLTATLFMQTALALLAYIGVNLAAGVGGYSAAVQVFVALAGLNLIIDILGNMCNDLLLSQERMISTSLVAILHVVVLVIFAWIGLASGYGLFGVYIGTILAGIGRSTALWLLVLRGGTRPVWPLDRTVARSLLWNGAPLALAAFLGLAYQQADKLLTNRLIGDAETGYLTAAFVIIFGVVEVLNTTVMTAVFPLLSRSYGDGSNPMFGFMVEKLGFLKLLVTLPVALVISVFAYQITVPLFGEDFRPTADVLRILIWYALASMVSSTLTYGFTVQNRQRRYLVIRAMGLGINILLLLVLLPVLGVTGAAFASLCAELGVMLALFLRFQAAGWDRRLLIPRAFRLALLGILVAGVMLVLGQVHPVLGGVVGLGLFAVGIPLFRILAADDLDLLYRMTAAMPGGALLLRYWRRDVKLNW